MNNPVESAWPTTEAPTRSLGRALVEASESLRPAGFRLLMVGSQPTQC